MHNRPDRGGTGRSGRRSATSADAFSGASLRAWRTCSAGAPTGTRSGGVGLLDGVGHRGGHLLRGDGFAP